MGSVIITLKKDSSNTITTPENTSTNLIQQKSSNTQKIFNIGVAYSVAQRSFSYLSSNVGKYSGNPHLQTQTNNLLQTLSLSAMSIANPVLFGITVGTQAVTTIAEETYRRKVENLSLETTRAQNGYSSTEDILKNRRH